MDYVSMYLGSPSPIIPRIPFLNFSLTVYSIENLTSFFYKNSLLRVCINRISALLFTLFGFSLCFFYHLTNLKPNYIIIDNWKSKLLWSQIHVEILQSNVRDGSDRSKSVFYFTWKQNYMSKHSLHFLLY